MDIGRTRPYAAQAAYGSRVGARHPWLTRRAPPSAHAGPRDLSNDESGVVTMSSQNSGQTQAAAPPPIGLPVLDAAPPTPERVWGAGPGELRAAFADAGTCAATHGCTVVATVTSFGGAVDDGVLVAHAVRHSARRDIHTGAHGWRLAPERALDRATALLGYSLTQRYRDAAGIEDTTHA